MKTFLVFLAMALILSACIVHQSDMNSYVLLQKWLKAAAEEAAAGGILMVDDSSYTRRSYIIDAAAAEKYAAFVTAPANNRASILALKNGTVTCKLSKLSDTQLKADVIWTAQAGYKLFRLPFLSSPQIVSQAAVYEVKE